MTKTNKLKKIQRIKLIKRITILGLLSIALVVNTLAVTNASTSPKPESVGQITANLAPKNYPVNANACEVIEYLDTLDMQGGAIVTQAILHAGGQEDTITVGLEACGYNFSDE